jgi:hypothetical protein
MAREAAPVSRNCESSEISKYEFSHLLCGLKIEFQNALFQN